jgi:hypothetical protein
LASKGSKPQIRFLDASGERLVTYLPWFGALVVAVLWAFGQHGDFLSKKYALTDMIVGLICLDTVHVVFTFVLFLGLPEIRTWASGANNPTNAPTKFLKIPWVQAGIVALTWGPLFFFSRFSSLGDVATIMLGFYLIEHCAPAFHTIAQMKGISLCFHSAIRDVHPLALDELRIGKEVESREKRLFQIFLLFECMGALPNILGSAKIAEFPTSSLWTKIPCGICATAMAITALMIMLNGRRYPHQERTKKTQFLSRLLLFPITFIIFPMYLIIRICHGTEYFAILRQMVGNARLTASRRRNVMLAAAGASLLYAVIAILTYSFVLRNFHIWKEPKPLFMAAFLVHISVRFAHFQMDRVLFRMKDPETRAVVAPLLVPRSLRAPAGVADAGSSLEMAS